MFQCVAVAKIKDGYFEKVFSAALILAVTTRSEPGNVYYNVLKPINMENTLIFIEKWDSESCFDRHVKGDACAEFAQLMSIAENSPSQLFPSEVII